ncbi:retention module-containing protein [Agarivorans litoreus]|uniref:retention module-containing protein n=1 Tax=Agarivorans litoreus TaxID=1510455 RepID=UPI001C7D3B83|nr:retention module-containing protein [Agarivorans litoreus]
MEQSIATSSATIVSIQGQAFAVDAQGNIRSLQPGDNIAPGELIITSQGAQLGFYYSDDQYVMGDNSATQLPEFDPSQTLSQLNAVNDLDVEALQQAILEGADPTELFEATAAGGTPASEGIAGGNGGFVTIDRIGEETIAQAGFDTQTPAPSSEFAITDNDAVEPSVASGVSNEPSSPAPSPDQAPTISLTAQAITEGAVDTNTVVATFSSSDPDGDVITHSLINDPQGFLIIDGNEIKLTEAGVTAVNDDQLNLTSLNITIQAEANGLTATDSADLSIARTDDGVTPPVDQGPSISVSAEALTEESVSTDTVVANFSSSDPEGDVQTYALLNNDDGYLVLDGNQVKLSDAGVAAVNNDTLNLSELEVSVEVTANGKTASDSDTASITRVDEGPSISVSAEALTEESVSTDTVVANFSSNDPEGDAQTYALLNNGDGYLVLDGNQVKLSDAGVAAVNNDTLNLSELEVSVEVTANGKTASANDTADVIRVNDAPTTSNVVLEPVAEDAVGGRVITEAELLANAGDIDNELADLSVSNLSLIGNGTLTNNNDGTWTYTPAENDDGSVSFSYEISDGEATISSGTADLDITPVNDAPTTSNVVLEPVAEDAVGGRVITEAELLANAGDIDNELADLSVSNLSLIGNGTLTNNNDGTWTYTPAKDDDGSVSFSYEISDGEATISSGTADLDITPVNDAPTTSNVVLEPVAEDAVGGRVITEAELLGNAGDIDNELADLSVSKLSLIGNGTLTNNNDGTWTYTPAKDDDGSVSFSYEISDGEATISSGTADLDITPVNDEPTTSNVVLDPVAEDAVGGRVITEAELLANAGDIDNELADLSVSKLSLNGNGTLTNNNDGTWTYTPAENDDGSVSFSYEISDGEATISTGTADLDITPVNDAPTTSNVVLEPVTEDAVGGRVITEAELLGNAGDIDNELADLSVSKLSLNGNGTLTNNNDGTWTYTPAENDDGSVSFSYDISDGEATISTGTADLDITPVNDAPTTSNVVLEPVAEDAVGGRVITEAELLANAGDIDNDLADLSVSNLSLIGNGTLTNNNDGTWTYTPAENDDGSVSFSYDISDGEATISTGTADLDITPVNDAPTTSNVVLEPVAEDAVGGRVITEAELLANAGDIDNDLADLSVSNLSLIGNGTLTNNNDGTWTYTPAENDDGSVSFSYDISDGEATISTGTADLDITPVNDAPTTSNVVLEPVAEDAVGGRVITEAELLANAGDIDNDLADLSVSNLSLIGNGTLTNNNDGTWTYTPAENDDGSVSFSYDISDGEATISTGTADLDITPVNDAPTTSNVVLEPVAEDAVGGRVITEAELLANAGDIDNELADLSVSNLSLIGNGTLTNNNDGTWTYTPAENDDGSVSFSYEISDGEATISSGTADLDITPVNDAPTTSNVVLEPVAEDAVGGRVITEAELLANAGDIDNELADLSVSNLSLIGNGTLTNNNDGTWTYTPAKDDDGSVSFSYEISDGEATISSGTADLDITPVNDAPTTSNVVLEPVAEDAVGGRVITEAELLGNAGDIDNELADLSVSKLSLIGNGTLTNNNDGTWTYTPAKDDDGSVSFSYEISDGEATISSGTADLDITPVNDAPTTSNVVLEPVAEDAVGGRVITEAELLGNAGDIDNELADLSVSKLSLIGNGTLTNNNDGTWTYTPAKDDDGSVSFSYEISDGEATISTGTADLDIIPVNDAPDAQDDDFANIASSETVLLDLVANDSDLEGDAISVKSIHGTDLTPGVAQSISVPNGVVNVSAAGVISYTASANSSGLVEFSYVLQDEHGAESSANVTGNVVSLVDDGAQVAESGLATGSDPSSASSLATGNLLANDDGLVDGLELSSVVYQGVPHTADANGVILIDTNQGQLSVYTQDYNGFSKGDYEYQLESASLAGDVVSESFNYVIANPASGFVTQATLDVNIVDDAPVGNDVSHSLESSPLLVTTNLVLVLDTSASMTNGEHGDGLNYLEIAVDALSNLIEQADAVGNVNVQIIGFSDSVISSGWIGDDVEDALTYLQNLSSGGGTHYDAALNEVIATSTSAQQPDADNTLLYFISDGEPNFGYGIDETVEYNGLNGLTAWDEFIRDNIDTSYGIGIGQADLEILRDIASESATDEFAFIVDDPNDLSVTIVESYLEAEVDASLGLLHTASTDGFMVGADDGYVSSIKVDNVTYTYDPNVVPEQEKNLSVTTALGGVLLLNFVTGAYSYELDVGGDGWGKQEKFEVSVTDYDGDSSSINIEINTVFEAVVDANRDVIITNQDGSSTISVPSLALLWNDTGDDISFDGVGTAVGGSVSGSDEILFDSDDGVGLGIHDSNFETEELSIIATAEDVSFVDFNGHDAVDLSDRSLFSLNDGNIPQIVSGGYSFTYQSELVNDNAPVTNADEDWIKVTLAKGEVLWANMATISGQERVKVDAFIYDAEGNLLVTDNGTTKFQEDWQGPRGSFTATEEGEYYIQIVADDDTDSGFYQMHLTIDASSAVYQKSALTDTQEEFEYSIIGDGGALDTTTAELIGVQGSSIDGGEGDEVLVGNEAANAIDGDAGDDALVGYAGDDQLDGGVGEDLLIGGQGNDILTGGDDSDMFAWLDGDDQGSSNDTITDFTLKDDSDPDNSPDVLDLSDLLQGETEASLESYLSFETVNNGGNVETIISIDKDGASNGESVHQTITLKDVDFSGMSDSEILSQLIEDQQLNVDN